MAAYRGGWLAYLEIQGQSLTPNYSKLETSQHGIDIEVGDIEPLLEPFFIDMRLLA